MSRKKLRAYRAIGGHQLTRSPLLWMNDGVIGKSCASFLKRLHNQFVDGASTKSKTDKMICRLGEQVGNSNDNVTVESILTAIGIAHDLPRIRELIDDVEFEALTHQLWAVAGGAQAMSALQQPLMKSLGIELGLTLGVSLSDRDAVLQNFLIEDFESLLEGQLDGDGWPAAHLLASFGLIAASWLRSILLIRKTGLELDFEIGLQVEWMVRQLLRMRQPEGRVSFGAALVNKNSAADFWRALCKASNDSDDKKLQKVLAGELKGKTKKEKQIAALRASEVAEPFNVSEWGSAALLRSSWSPKSPMLAISYGGTSHASCTIDLSRGRSLLAGNSMPTVSVDGKSLEPVGEFELVCDRSDEDLDYLEIQIELGRGGRLNRQFLLSRTDEFLLIADTIVPGERVLATIGYESRFPFAQGMEGLLEKETREVYLQRSTRPQKIQALVLPLSLPEWQLERVFGRNGKEQPAELAIDGSGLTLSQQQFGFGIHVPLLIDLNPQRSCRKRTWRRLTVAEDRTIIPPDFGCAFRFQLDQSQWFYYRAVASGGNRTFLGENTSSEFVFNQFREDGTVTELLEVK